MPPSSPIRFCGGFGIRTIFASYVRARGHATEVAADGAAALEILRRGNVDVVFSDVRMAGLDGLALLREIRSRWPEVVVVLISLDQPANLPAGVSSSGAAALVCKQDFGPRMLRQLWLAHAPRR